MKIAICGDVHWSQYSSILRKRGEKYSVRLENLIKSLNWFNELSSEHNCMANLYLGDFFDKPELNSEEISALKEIRWSGCSQYFLCGNHELGAVDHRYSSAKVFNLLDIGEVLDTPDILRFKDIDIYVLPYTVESNRKPIKEYFPKLSTNKTITISHNDVAGVQMGKIISESGFSIDEFEGLSELTFNGHLHNGEKLSDKVYNVGNLTGQNFSEDAFKHEHKVYILDTSTMKFEEFVNPYAFNFYKIDTTIGGTKLNLNSLKTNAVLTVKCFTDQVEEFKKQIAEKRNKIVESHFVIQPRKQAAEEDDISETLAVDHLEAFKKYMLDKFDNSKELMEELREVLR